MGYFRLPESVLWHHPKRSPWNTEADTESALHFAANARKVKFWVTKGGRCDASEVIPVWVFPYMVVPPKHPKMIIFSRKTHGCCMFLYVFLITRICISKKQTYTKRYLV